MRVARKIIYTLMVISILLMFIDIPYIHTAGSYRTPITITEHSGNSLTDYQVKIELTSSWDGWSYVSSDGGDIYFLDANGNPLYYWIEEFDYSNQEATIWVKIPSIPASSSTTIYMYYGGTNNYPDYNDPSKVFLFYEDFEGSSSLTIDNILAGSTYSFDNTWSIHGSYSFKYSDTSSSDYGEVRIYTSYTTLGIVVEVYVKPDLDQTKLHVFGFYFDSTNGRTLGIKYTASTSKYSLGVIGVETKVTEGWSNNLYKFVGKFKPNGILTIEYYDDTGFLVDSYTTTNSYTIDVIGLKFYTGGGQVGDIQADLFIVRKFVDPEPSITIGSSEAVGGILISSVVPDNVFVEPGETIDFNITIVNNYGSSMDVYIRIYDHNDVVRAETSATLVADSTSWYILSVSVTGSDRGDWVWRVVVENSTYVFDEYNVSVGIHLVVDYSGTTGVVHHKGGISIGTSSGSYESVIGTYYDANIYFVYNGISDPPDDYVRFYVNSSLYASIYIPNGDTVVHLSKNTEYSLEIPSSGYTVNGYTFVLDHYTVNDVVNPSTIVANTDLDIYIYYNVTSESVNVSLVSGPAVVNITVSGEGIESLSSNTLIYGGDEFYYTDRLVSGLISVSQISSSWVYFGDYESVLIQYPNVSFKGAGFYESGQYIVIGYYLNTTSDRIVFGRFEVDAYGTLLGVVEVFYSIPYDGVLTHSGKLIFYKGSVCAMVYVSNSKWYTLCKNNTGLSSVSYIIFIDGYPSEITVMRGDYLSFTGDGIVAVKIDGVDALGKEVHLYISDNGPLDSNDGVGSIFVGPLNVVYPINGSITVYRRREDVIGGGIPKPEIIGYNVSYNIVPNYNFSRVNQSGLSGFVVPFISDFAEYRDVVAVIIILLVILLANEVNAPFFGAMAVGLMVFFTSIGWLSISGTVLGLLILVVGLGFAIVRKRG